MHPKDLKKKIYGSVLVQDYFSEETKKYFLIPNTNKHKIHNMHIHIDFTEHFHMTCIKGNDTESSPKVFFAFSLSSQMYLMICYFFQVTMKSCPEYSSLAFLYHFSPLF